VVSHVVKYCQVDLPLKSLFESPTVAEMASVITEHQGKILNDAQLEGMLAELESMSDEQAERLLADERRSTSTGRQHE
jgi:hypothetical protein